LYIRYDFQPQWISIAAGTIDEDTVKGALPIPDHHIFVGEKEKAGWEVLPEDGLRRCDGFNKEFQEKLDQWKQERAEKAKQSS
jgi:hypothetical protein